MTKDEIWKDITGFESKYEVSDLGRVRSLDRYSKHNTSKTGFILQKGQMLKPFMSKKGYLKVDLGDGFGKPKRPVYQIDKKTNEIVARFNSVKEAGVALGMKKPSNITTVCKGNRPYAGGYKWQYAPSKKEVMPNDVK